MMKDQMKELTVLPLKTTADYTILFKIRKVRTDSESDCVDLDLQNDYIGFGYCREINGFPRL